MHENIEISINEASKVKQYNWFCPVVIMANFFHTVPLSRRVAVTPGNINMESLVTIAGIWKGEIPEQQLKLKAVTVSYCYKALHLRCLRRSWLRRCSLVKYLFRVIFKTLDGNKVDSINDC